MKINPNQTYMIPLGGCGEFGKNLTLYVHRQRIFVVDCGIKFADERMLGISGLIPDVAEAFNLFGQVEAYIITHGHEDHIGAIAYIASRWPAPIYCTPWTQRLIERRLDRLGWKRKALNLNTVSAGRQLKFDDVSIEYVHVNHSIPMCCALYMRFPDVSVFHTGDFKVDPDPVIEPKTDFDRLAAIGRAGIDYMVSDSTSVEIRGDSPGEKDVRKQLEATVAAAEGRIYLSTFASNFWRVKSILEICKKLGKKLYVAGSSFYQTMELADEFKMLGQERDCLIEEEELAGYPRHQTVVLASGSQGEWRSALYRISHDELAALRVEAGDTVIFSSRVIPGNEKNLFNMISRLTRLGAKAITGKTHPGIHVSGHAQQGDVVRYLQQLQPKNFLAVHGTFMQISENQQLGSSHARLDTNLLLENGNVIALGEHPDVIGQLESQAEFIDQDSNVPLDYETMRHRHRIGEVGGIIVSGVFGKRSHNWLSPVEVSLIGLSLPGEAATQGYLAELEDDLSQSLQRAVTEGEIAANEDEVNEWARRRARRSALKVLQKKPVVMTYLFLI